MNEQQESETIVAMRTHLTVLTLAVGQLRRRHGKTADIERLCAFAETAIARLQEDIAAVHATLVQGKRREESRTAHLHLRQSPTSEAYRLETGSLPLPAPDLREQQ